MDKRRSAAEVNSSYTIFFALSAVAIAFIFSTSFSELENKSWIILTCYALLIYFIWDFIKQLYSPGQSIILFILTFIILPVVFTYTLSNVMPQAWQVGRAAWVIWLGATIMAGLLELSYKFISKHVLPNNILKRLVIVDNRLDKSLLTLNDKHLSFFNFRGFILASTLITVFYICSFLLLNY